MNPRPSLSYTLNASFSSLFIVSMSGSSTRKVAQSWQNSPNSISPEPSSWSPCQGPPQGRWHRAGRIPQTQSPRSHLHGLHVRVLHKEGGTELAEFPKLNLPGAIFMVSMSGSSTRKVAQSWQNSPNSISPEP